jgi:hypothetical protein
MAFAYGDTYIANPDLKTVIDRKSSYVNAGFKTGDKIISAMVKKSPN